MGQTKLLFTGLYRVDFTDEKCNRVTLTSHQAAAAFLEGWK
jgi:hypothetical protein